MSLNIKTPNGLIEVSGKTTKEKVISALGYIPADVTKLENIDDNNSECFSLIDPNGNIIMQVDDKGVHTTNVESESMSTNSDDLIIQDEAENIIVKVDKTGLHATNVNANIISINGIALKLETWEVTVEKDDGTTETIQKVVCVG